MDSGRIELQAEIAGFKARIARNSQAITKIRNAEAGGFRREASVRNQSGLPLGNQTLAMSPLSPGPTPNLTCAP
jgi:hypothetical protein